MQKNSFVHYVTKVIVDIMFFGGIIACAAVPYLLKIAAGYFDYSQDMVIRLSVVLIASGLTAVYILWQLKMIFKTLLGGNPFVTQNVSFLRKISVACFIISIIYIYKCTFWFTIATGIIVIIFAVASLFCLTLKDVFKQAVQYKEENDLTV